MPLGGVLLIVGLAVLAAAGTFVVEWLLPAWKRQPINEVVGFVYAVVGVAYSVLLGLVVIAGLTNLDTAQANVFAETNAVQQLDWYGSSLPKSQPMHAEIEGLAKEYDSVVINTEWPLLAEKQTSPKAWAIYTQLRLLILAQNPATPADVARYQQALDATADWGDARRQRIDESTTGIPSLLWAALILGGFVTVGFAYLFGIKNTVAHAVIMFFLTLLVSALLLVVFEFNEPFAGVVRVTPQAFQLALARMQQIP
jgi:Protein of unknown function (DUF4239)